jgi:hypothetical protein
MTVQVIRGDAIAPVPGFPRQTGELIANNAMSIGDFGGTSGQRILVGTTGSPNAKFTTGGTNIPPPVGGKVYLLPPDSTMHVAPFRSSGVVAVSTAVNRGFWFSPAVADINGDGIPDLITIDRDVSMNGTLSAFSLATVTPDSLPSLLFANLQISGPQIAPVVSDSLIAVGSWLGGVYFIRFDGMTADSVLLPPLTPPTVFSISRWVGANSFLIGYATGTVRLTRRTGRGNAAGPDVIRQVGYAAITGMATGLFGPDSTRGRILTAIVNGAGSLYLVDSSLTPLPGFPVSIGSVRAGPVLADVDGDGMRDIIVCGDAGILAYNVGGTLLDNFPFRVPDGDLLEYPVVGDVDGDGKVDIIAPSQNGLVYAVTGKGSSVPGFPLLAGSGSNAVAANGTSIALLTAGGKIILAAASNDGSISAWVTGHYSGSPDPKLYPWPQYGRDSRHSGMDLTPLRVVASTSAFFPPDRTYNWPNPVYSGQTFFRYFVKDNATVNIKIFDMAGDLVTTLTGQGTGGIDNEIPWDVSHVQSGIYFARIEASSGGTSGVKIVKVAVVK